MVRSVLRVTASIDLYLGVSRVYLLIAEEMGLIGLASVLLMTGVFLAYGWRAWRRTENDSALEPVPLGLGGSLGRSDGGRFGRPAFPQPRLPATVQLPGLLVLHYKARDCVCAASSVTARTEAANLIHNQSDFENTADSATTKACDGCRPTGHGQFLQTSTIPHGPRIRILLMTQSPLE